LRLKSADCGDFVLQFSEAIGDCKLVDSSDAYLLKWLAGKTFT
jgi:hypothetical protein